MKKIITIILLILISTFVSCSSESVDSLQKLKGQELICESSSPDKKYVIKAYKNNGGATVDFAVLCVLMDKTTKNTKNIYWQYHEDEVVIEWIDNDTVKINAVTLNLPDDTYDWRNN